MLKIEERQLFRWNGLIDDFVVYGRPEDYLALAEMIQSAPLSGGRAQMETSTSIWLEIVVDESESGELYTSLQTQKNEYYSMSDWNSRNYLRIIGCQAALEELRLFIIDVAGRGEGYSYMSEYSDRFRYALSSPEVRLHVQST